MSHPTVVKVESCNVKTFKFSGSGISSFRIGSGLSEVGSARITGDEIQVATALAMSLLALIPDAIN